MANTNGGNNQINLNTMSVLDHYKESLKTFSTSAEQVCSRKNTPRWFQDFSKLLANFLNDFSSIFMDLEKHIGLVESELSIQKAVTDGLQNERQRLEDMIRDNKDIIYELEGEVEDLRQYSRRTNLLIHGMEEEDKEDTDAKVLELLQN